MAMRTLLIDNYDSYTYNLYQLLSEVLGVEPLVYKNDAIDLAGVQALLSSGQVQSIVISPGPGSPERASDIGVCLDILQQLPDVPVLGVCLGHQALAVAAGGRIVRAPEPVHGRISEIHHSGHPLMAGIPSGRGQGYEVVRYHSLVVDPGTLPACLEAIAWSHGTHHAVATEASGGVDSASAASDARDSGSASSPACSANEPAPLIMGLAHRTRPHYGVQFHPESVCTTYGMHLVLNFARLACAHRRTDFQLQRYASSTVTHAPGTYAAQTQSRDSVRPFSATSRTVSGQCADEYGRPLLRCREVSLSVRAPGRQHAAHPWPSPGKRIRHPIGLHWRKLSYALKPHEPTEAQHLFQSVFAFQPMSFWLDR